MSPWGEQMITRACGTGRLPVLAACVLLVLGASELRAQTSPGTVIRNWATVTYQAATGASFAPLADTAAVTVGAASGIAVTLTKNVDRPTGTLGDILTYSLAYQALGSAAATNLVIADVLPAGAVYLPASLTLGGAPLTDATGDDAGAFEGAANRVVVVIPAVTGGDAGTITFRARLDGTASPSNVARADYTTPLGPDSAASNAAPTTLLFANLSVAKLLDSPATARVGDAVSYRIRYDNPAAGVTARNVVVTDTLPAGLEYESAIPAATVAGAVVTWTLGDVAAGTTAEVVLQTRVAPTLPDSVTVINAAALAADNAPAAAGAASPVLLLLAGTGQLALDKRADVLEAGLGETVPYSLTLGNTGATALADLRIADRLPAGGRYAKGSVLGADSVTVAGRDLTIYVAGPLAPGATHTVRYRVALVSAERDVLENTAVATAQGGLVQSATARAWVRVRRAWPLETRGVIGRVFADRDGNGIQAGGEPGLAGVDVWTDDGGISTTDADGRFSFQDLRLGRHAFRIDPTTLPAEYATADAAQVATRDASGWTTPRVNFALTPGRAMSDRAPAAANDAARLAVPLRFTARPACGSLDGVLPGARGDHAVVAHFSTNDARPRYVLEPDVIGRRLQQHLVRHADCALVIAGHTDTADVSGGPYWSNERLSQERARWVAHQLRWRGVGSGILHVVGRGATEPVGGRADSTAHNRRVEVQLVDRRGARPDTEYEVRLSNPYTMNLPGVELTFDPPARAVTTADGVALVRLSDGRWAIPTIPAGGEVTVRARARASVLAGVTASAGTVVSRAVVAEVHNPLRPTVALTDPIVPARATAPAVPETVTVAALRSAAARAADARSALTAGPGVTAFAPADGAVLATDRVFVGVRGQAGAAVELFDGAAGIARAQLRPDGVHDFIAVRLARGPHRLRVRMMNSWGKERWDSLAVHVSGRPATFTPERAPVLLAADGRTVAAVRVRVQDRWGVPVTGGVFVTATADGAEVVSPDDDRSSVGVQLRTDAGGWVTVQLRGGRDVRLGALTLASGDVTGRVALEVLPATRPFMLTAVGRAGLGASPDAFGAVTARGRLDERTSLVMSLDSRQLDAAREGFAHSFDPLEQARYPMLGDSSTSRTMSASPYVFAARVERGFDWLAVGDLATGGFARGLVLAGYDRALSGVAGRVTTGAVVWQGFGSSSTQQLGQLQIRGRGMSGPYDLAQGLRPGSERVAIETRAIDNAQRTLAREVLTRYTDYQIDYDQGLLLFGRAVPAADASGNPVFIVVTYEASGAGAASTVWGLRASGDAHGVAGGGLLDSLRLGSTFIRDERPGAERELAGLDVGLVRIGAVALRGELARSATRDSSGYASSIEGTMTLGGGAVAFTGGWLRADQEFHNPSNAALSGGTEDLRLGARFRAGTSQLRLEHSAQRFPVQGVSRTRSGAVVTQTVGRLQAEAGWAADGFETGTGAEASQAGEVKLTFTPVPAVSLWAEGRRALSATGSTVRPEFLGGGARMRLGHRGSLEASHRQVTLPGGADYGVTTFGARSELGAGTQAWGSYQVASGGAPGAAVLGFNNRLQLTPGWTVHALFERRVGLDRAPAVDPVRALPFLQVEEDYWSAALGTELRPRGAPYRLSARGELRDGADVSSRLVTLSGDLALTRAFSVLSRQELLATERNQATSATRHRRFSSLTGIAFRPVGWDALNVLGKVEYVGALNPLGGGVLTAETGTESRTILAVEAIWSPLPGAEVAARYAVRRADASVTHADGVVQALGSSAAYVGGQIDIALTGRLGLRAEGRLLDERTSGVIRWDGAPQLVVRPARGLEVSAGYRVGDLQDPDFAVRGGAGWFVTFGAAISEQSLAGLADFWRNRMGR